MNTVAVIILFSAAIILIGDASAHHGHLHLESLPLAEFGARSTGGSGNQKPSGFSILPCDDSEDADSSLQVEPLKPILKPGDSENEPSPRFFFNLFENLFNPNRNRTNNSGFPGNLITG